jgi:hypothetical protein
MKNTVAILLFIAVVTLVTADEVVTIEPKQHVAQKLTTGTYNYFVFCESCSIKLMTASNMELYQKGEKYECIKRYSYDRVETSRSFMNLWIAEDSFFVISNQYSNTPLTVRYNVEVSTTLPPAPTETYKQYANNIVLGVGVFIALFTILIGILVFLARLKPAFIREPLINKNEQPIKPNETTTAYYQSENPYSAV